MNEHKYWEYEIKNTTEHFTNKDLLKDYLNDMGKDGWELVKFTYHLKMNEYIFKRPKAYKQIIIQTNLDEVLNSGLCFKPVQNTGPFKSLNAWKEEKSTFTINEIAGPWHTIRNIC